MPHYILSRLKAAAVACAFPVLVGACQPAPPKAEKDGLQALRDAGYAPSPVITSVTDGNPGTLIVVGEAMPDGRVGFVYGSDHNIGFTADSKGHFRAELPASPQGSVFDVSMEDSGRLMHAEGRLFVPPGQPGKAVLLRPGAPSLPVVPQASAVTVLDYDAAGALAVVGRVAPKTAVNVLVNGQIRGAQPQSDANGYYTAMTQMIPAPNEIPMSVNVTVEAAGASWKRDITVTQPSAGDKDVVTPIAEGWRVDWTIPGGGRQTTLVF